MKKLIITEDYQIELVEVPETKLLLSPHWVDKFSRLDYKGKVSKMAYLKKEHSKTEEIKSVISGSKYLYLLQDNSGLHIRIDQDISEEDLELETKIIEFLFLEYPVKFDEEINNGSSGDRNRVRIAKGSLIDY